MSNFGPFYRRKYISIDLSKDNEKPKKVISSNFYQKKFVNQLKLAQWW